MWYVFKNNECIASCDFKPNIEDLASRGEIAVESETQYEITKIALKNGGIVKKPAPVLTDAERLSQLDAEYKPQFAQLAQSLGLATLDGNQTVIDGVKSDYATLKVEYEKKRGEIVG